MTQPENPTIILIPGAWHQASTYEPVAALLRAQGYPAHTLTLLSSGGPTSTTVADDAAYIRDTLLADLVAQGKEVVLALHSYSGVAGSESVRGLARRDLAAQGKPGGVVALVYVSGFMLRAGQTVDSFLGGVGNVIVFEGNKAIMTDPVSKFYADLDPESAVRAAAAIQYHAKPTFFTPLTYEAYRDVPATYLLCEGDRAIPLKAQQKMVDAVGDIVQTRVCAAGHSPMLAMPQTVAEVIIGAARAGSATKL
ncbi:alpha/beta-hydrolase [Penicillium alfredii]|uniref:Alpha/beta-hydrolase n=1 Tax=Penicillium alfredii TaxID=1506179 RepID=A0A9W9JZ23_9EURO|nr:alpha/beta-hydrolase [Penicillium alfredii]KAJ5086775.1 alpha/beta-hydrolase [Penicillium alfredii]